MKCYTAIKTLLIGLGVTSFSLSDCMQYRGADFYYGYGGNRHRSMQVFNAAKQGTSVVVNIHDPVQATLMQIAQFAKSGQTNLTELVSKELLLEAMMLKPRLWGTHLKCLYVGRGCREGDRNTTLAKGLYEYYKNNLNWKRTSEEEILFLGKFLRSSKIIEFEYPAKVQKEHDDYIYSDIVKDADRVMIEFHIQDGNGGFIPTDYQDRVVRLILDHVELAKVCMLHLSGNVDINEYGPTIVCLGHAGQQIGMVNQVKQQNAELISHVEDLSKQIVEEKDRNEGLSQQVRELKAKISAFEKRESDFHRQDAEIKELNSLLSQQAEELRASNARLSVQLEVARKLYAEQEEAMCVQVRDFINVMIDGVSFAEPWINDLLRSSSMRVRFFEGDGLSVTDGMKRITLSRLTQAVNESRGAIQQQTLIALNQQCNPLQTQVYPNMCHHSSSTNMAHQSQIGFKQPQPQYLQSSSMSVQSTGIAPNNQISYASNVTSVQQRMPTNFDQQANSVRQPQYSQNASMSVQSTGIAPSNQMSSRAGSYEPNPASVQPYMSINVNPPTNSMQRYGSQGVTMSVPMPNVAQQRGADHYMSQKPYGYFFPK